MLREIAAENVDLMIVDVGEGSLTPSPALDVRDVKALVKTSFTEENAEISPDGRWLAYQSNQSGRVEVYVRPCPDVGGDPQLVSTAGGTEPLWARDGRELFYGGPMGTVMGVSVAPGSTWVPGTPTQLIEALS